MDRPPPFVTREVHLVARDGQAQGTAVSTISWVAPWLVVIEPTAPGTFTCHARIDRVLESVGRARRCMNP
jgi:hypothetical protein